MKTALDAFETLIRNDTLCGVFPEFYLEKLDSYSADNPEFLDKGVDHDWQMFLKGWNAAKQTE